MSMEPLPIVADDPLLRCKMDGNRILAEKNTLTFKRGLGEITGWDRVISQEICNIPGIIIRKTGEPVKVARFEVPVPKWIWKIDRNDT